MRMQMSEHLAGAAAAAPGAIEHKLLDPFSQHSHAQMQLHLLPPPPMHQPHQHHPLAHHGAHSGAFQWHHVDDASKRSYEPQDFDDQDSHALHDDDDDNDENDHNESNRGAGTSGPYAAAHPSSLAAPSASMLALGLPATSGKAPRKTKREIFECPEVHCGKVFPRSFALRRHMRIHTGNKPYACDHEGCSQKFNTSGNLSRHKRIHSGERPYPCVYASCGKRFNTSTKLKRHMRIHFPDGQNLFQCAEPACAWACDNYKEYVTHQRLHGSVAGESAAPVRESKPSVTAAAARKPAKPRAANGASRGTAANAGAVDGHTETVQFHAATDAMAVAPPVYSRRSPEFLSHQHVHLSQHTSTAEGVHYGEREFDARRLFVHSLDPREHGRESEHHQHHQHHQHHHGSSSTSSSLHERDLDLEHEYESSELSHSQSQHFSHHVRRDAKHDERPRLPFPTQSFPSESSFHHSHLHAPSHHAAPMHHRPAYFEHSSSYSSGYGSSSNGGSAYGSYVRGPHDGYASPHQHQHQHHPSSSSSEPHYESHYSDSGRRSEDSNGYESPVNTRASHVSEDVKYAYAAAGIAPTPEFTGEELSAVLELMKDS